MRMPLPLMNKRRRTGFNPSALFADGGNGILWDFTSTAPLFTDSAGTTPLTAATQTIGMVRDGSRARSPATAYAGVQASAGLRPSYGIAPASRRQLLTYSEDFANAAWSLNLTNNGITTNSTAAPDGTMTADFVFPKAVTAIHVCQKAVTTTNAAQYIASVYVKANGYSKFGIRENAVTGAYATFNLSSVSVISQGSGGTGSISSVGDGWYRVSMLSTASTSFNTTFFVLDDGYSSGSPSAYTFAGNGTSGIYLWGAQLELAGSVSTYQKSVTALEITETGFATYGYTQPDRSDDILSTVLTLAQTGDVMIFGRTGSWLETGRVYGAGATFSVGLSDTVGPNASQITGLTTLNILRAVGDVVGIVAMGRASTAAEQASAMAYFGARGAAGFLAVSGAELVTNGDFASGTTGWTANAAATISNVANRLRITALAATPAAYTSFATVIGKSYLLTATYVTDAITGNAFVYAGINATDSSNLSLDLGSTVGTYTATFVATATTTFVRLSGNASALITETMDWDNVSCKLLVAS